MAFTERGVKALALHVKVDTMFCLVFPLDAETNSVCEIVHVKSESEGRPERTFHLCCR